MNDDYVIINFYISDIFFKPLNSKVVNIAKNFWCSKFDMKDINEAVSSLTLI